jgi:hypothetical protein
MAKQIETLDHGQNHASRTPTRSVAVTGNAATDTFTVPAGFLTTLAPGCRVSLSGLTGGAGLSTGVDYYILGDSLTATTFKVSTTPNGRPVDITTNLTAGTVSTGKLSPATDGILAANIVPMGSPAGGGILQS